MREKYAEACKQRSLDSLLSLAAQREQIYQQTIPQIVIFVADQRQKRELLEIAGKSRALSTQTAALGRSFLGGNPIVTNYDPAIIIQIISYEQQRRNLQFDPQRPTIMQLEAMWKEVE